MLECEYIVSSVSGAVEKRGIYVYDRGGDRNEIFRFFIAEEHDFIVRMMKKRYLMYNGERLNILVLCAMCHTPRQSVVQFNSNGEDKDTGNTSRTARIPAKSALHIF